VDAITPWPIWKCRLSTRATGGEIRDLAQQGLSSRAEGVQQAGFFEWGNNPHGLTFDADTLLPAQDNRVFWCHFNSRSVYPWFLSGKI